MRISSTTAAGTLALVTVFAHTQTNLLAQGPPVIHNAVADASQTTMRISGVNFGSSPIVTFDDQPATVISATESERHHAACVRRGHARQLPDRRHPF